MATKREQAIEITRLRLANARLRVQFQEALKLADALLAHAIKFSPAYQKGRKR